MKRFVGSLIVVYFFCLMFGMFGQVSASSSPKLFLDGKPIVTDVDPVLTKGTTLVPLAVLSEQLGYEVKWNNELKEASIINESTHIQLTIGNKIALVNNESYEMLEAPSLLQKRTMVPVRFVVELLGMKVDWKQEEWEVHIMTPVVENPTSESEGIKKATITNVFNDNDATIHIDFTGELASPKVMELQEPRRLVVDFADTGFSEIIANSFIEGKTEVLLEGYEHITGYRYSLFNNSPLVSRFVVVLNEDAAYTLLQSDNEVRIMFGLKSDEPLEGDGQPAAPDESVVLPPADTEKIFHIVLDAGHGDKDPGAISKINGKKEKDFNLSAVLKLKAELEKHPQIKVHLTRADDTYVELDDRVLFAQNLPSGKADIFISIHANSFDKSTVNGSETYYSRENSKLLAETLHPYILSGIGLNDRGVKTAGFKVIKATTMPAVLLEIGYMSNEKDVKALFDEAIQQKLAVELTKGVKKYLNLQ